MVARSGPALKGSARYTRAGHNKSLDASGTSGLVIGNLSVTRLSPAASTQTLSRFAFENKALGNVRFVVEVATIARDENGNGIMKCGHVVARSARP